MLKHKVMVVSLSEHRKVFHLDIPLLVVSKFLEFCAPFLKEDEQKLKGLPVYSLNLTHYLFEGGLTGIEKVRIGIYSLVISKGEAFSWSYVDTIIMNAIKLMLSKYNQQKIDEVEVEFSGSISFNDNTEEKDQKPKRLSWFSLKDKFTR